MLDFIVWPVRCVIDWWDLRRAQLARDPHILGLTLEDPLLKRMMGMVPFEGSKIKWCVSLFVAGRDDHRTESIFGGKRRRLF